MIVLPDQLNDFNDYDKISDFSSIGESLYPNGCKLQIDKSRAVFYKLESCKTFHVLAVTKAIVVDDNLQLSFSFLAVLHPSFHGLLKERIVD